MLPATRSPHSGLLKKGSFYVKSLIVFHPVSHFLSDKVYTNPLFQSPFTTFCFTLVLFISVCSYLFMFPCYPMCISCLYPVLSVPSNFYYLFLMFLFISIGYRLLLNVSLGPQLFSFPVLWVESGLVPTLSLSSVHAAPKAALPGCACIPDSDCLHSYKGCVFFSLSVSAFEGQHTFGVSLASLNADNINVL